MLPLKRILCPTDFSAPSYLALEAAVELAQHFSSELLLLHVVKPSVELSMAPEAMMVPNIPEPIDMTAAAKEDLAKLRKERTPGGLTVVEMVLHGLPADEIARKAGEEKADVIVMGTHGLTGWRHLVFGSVAEKVVRLAACPVITVPDPQKMI